MRSCMVVFVTYACLRLCPLSLPQSAAKSKERKQQYMEQLEQVRPTLSSLHCILLIVHP